VGNKQQWLCSRGRLYISRCVTFLKQRHNLPHKSTPLFTMRCSQSMRLIRRI